MWNSLETFLAFFGISRESRVDPLDRTVQRVLAGCSLEELESTPCPYCGAPQTVAFEDDGGHFVVQRNSMMRADNLFWLMNVVSCCLLTTERDGYIGFE